MKFFKYQALGNDYLIIEPSSLSEPVRPELIRRLCNRRFGIGADGVLIGPWLTSEGAYGLRIYNADGSECEKSGNGLRLFARYLIDVGHAPEEGLSLYLFHLGETIEVDFLPVTKAIRVTLGNYSFGAMALGVNTELPQLCDYRLELDHEIFTVSYVYLGNPHCVVWVNKPSAEFAQTWGPRISTCSLFPQKANVQFASVQDRSNMQIEIWERGAGYTLASGSSACAAAAVAYKAGLVDTTVTVQMPGGAMRVDLRANHTIALTGPAELVYQAQVISDF
ncbi:diaminopimelate epimerase [Glaciimonas immobilis]|uniref:Diaminopimelate epimerase n=1 Tax=Glaciimonas immobilis TaxID=728004 RepID=A0A840RVL0_9BURK|nr:diaminopimelate epimerase [Glaciimonas immobilis]KAF3995938.1 diaminopimelate epimerase [Glaciimonas immobilis]MBB5202677.1 diaminopimelate epimerase [Glaciimonas immobilis]